MECKSETERFSAAGMVSCWWDADTVPHAHRKRFFSTLENHSGALLQFRPEEAFMPDIALTRVLNSLEKISLRGAPTYISLRYEHGLRSVPDLSTVIVDRVVSGDKRRAGVRLRPEWLKDQWVNLEPDAFLMCTLPSGDWEGEMTLSSSLNLPEPSEEEIIFAQAFQKEFGRSVYSRLAAQVPFSILLGTDSPLMGERYADFALSLGNLRFVFEIDGLQHQRREQSLHDEERDRALVAAGWEVIRFTASQIREDAIHILRSLAKTSTRFEKLSKIAERQAKWTSAAAADRLRVQCLVAEPIAIQRCLRALITLFRRGILHQGRTNRMLLIEQDVPGVVHAADALCAQWQHLAALGSNVAPPPNFDIDVIGSVSPVPVPSDSLVTLRKVGTPTGEYDMCLSHSLVLIPSRRGPLEATLEGDSVEVTATIRADCGTPVARQLPGRDGVEFDLNALEDELRNQSGANISHNAQLQALRFFLGEIFRKQDFFPRQALSIVRLLQRKQTIALLPTGAGKSLIFQLSGLLLPGTTVVVAPLVALIEDQLENLKLYGIDHSGCITGNQSHLDKLESMKDLALGRVSFLYVAPERFQMPSFRTEIRDAARMVSIPLAVIDEAHCLSQWGHDFRPSYLHLGRNLRKYATDRDGRAPTLAAFTGTASFAVLQDIQDDLSVSDESSLIIPDTFDRPEIQFVVEKVKPDERAHRLKRWLEVDVAQEIGERRSNFFELRGAATNCGIIFCPHVNGDLGVKAVADGLGVRDIYSGKAPRGFSGDWGEHKTKVMRRFKQNESAVVVATNSLGMGLDKENIRFTIHYVAPGSVEALYQEAGRAGRSGHSQPCLSVVLYSDEDRKIPQFFHYSNFPSAEREKGAVVALWNTIISVATGMRREVVLPFNMEEAVNVAQEKAIYRLMHLGLLEDYAKDWSHGTYVLELAPFDRQKVVDRLRVTLGRHWFHDAVETVLKPLEDPVDEARFISAAVSCLLDFVYGEIEARRAQAISTVIDLCAGFRDREEFRAQLLAYLEESEFSKELSEWRSRSFDEVGITALESVVARVDSPDAVRRLVGSTRRFLDEEPINVPVRVLSVVARSRSPYEIDASVLAELDYLVMNRVSSPRSSEVGAIAEFLLIEFQKSRPSILRAASAALLKAWPQRGVAIQILSHADEQATVEEVLTCHLVLVSELAHSVAAFRNRQFPI